MSVRVLPDAKSEYRGHEAEVVEVRKRQRSSFRHPPRSSYLLRFSDGIQLWFSQEELEVTPSQPQAQETSRD